MPSYINRSPRFSCNKGCDTHLGGFPPRSGSGWTDEHIQSLACTKATLSDALVDKVLALIDVQQVNSDRGQLQKHVRDIEFLERFGYRSSSSQGRNFLAIPERKFVLIPWHAKATINRLLVLAFCFPGFIPGQQWPTAVVFDNLAKSEIPHWYQSCDRAVQHATTVVAEAYGLQKDKKYEVSRVTWQHSKEVDDASIAQLGVIHTVQMIVESRGEELKSASPSRLTWTPRDVREGVLRLIGNHYGSMSPLTPKSAMGANERVFIGRSSTPQTVPRSKNSRGIIVDPYVPPTRSTKTSSPLASRGNRNGVWGASNGDDDTSVIYVQPQLETGNTNNEAKSGGSDCSPQPIRQSQPSGENGTRRPTGKPVTALMNADVPVGSGTKVRSPMMDRRSCQPGGTPSPAEREGSCNLTDRTSPPTTPEDVDMVGGIGNPPVRVSITLPKKPTVPSAEARSSARQAKKTLVKLATPSRKRPAEVSDSNVDDVDSDAPLIRRRRLKGFGDGQRQETEEKQQKLSITSQLGRVLTEAVAVASSVEGLAEAERSAAKSLDEVADKMKKYLDSNVFTCAGLVNEEFLGMEKEREASAVKMKRAVEDKKIAEGQVESAKLLCREFLENCKIGTLS